MIDLLHGDPLIILPYDLCLTDSCPFSYKAFCTNSNVQFIYLQCIIELIFDKDAFTSKRLMFMLLSHMSNKAK